MPSQWWAWNPSPPRGCSKASPINHPPSCLWTRRSCSNDCGHLLLFGCETVTFTALGKSSPADFTTQTALQEEWESEEVRTNPWRQTPTARSQAPTFRGDSGLNSSRTGHGSRLRRRWGSSPSPLCTCGEEQTP